MSWFTNLLSKEIEQGVQMRHFNGLIWTLHFGIFAKMKKGQ